MTSYLDNNNNNNNNNVSLQVGQLLWRKADILSGLKTTLVPTLLRIAFLNKA
jgi:hypothetical protein